ncbi:MAG TPA: iron chelate uptake ABC transporter family permease subunit, partial [Myxococcaceae bacterium]
MTTVARPLPAPSGVRFTPARASLVLVGLLLLLAATLAASALLGEYPVDLARALADPASPDGRVLFGLRVPRAVLGALVGASLAASGSALQALLRNPLADSFVLGVSGGAALGATLALALGLQAVAGPSVFAFVGAVAAMALVLAAG